MSNASTDQTAAQAAIAAARARQADAPASNRTGRAPTDAERAEADATGKKPSPKSKEARGVSAELITTWVPFDSTPSDNERLHKAAKARKVKVTDVLNEILAKALADPAVQKSLDDDAAKAPEPKAASDLSKKTPEQLEAAADKARVQLAAITARLEAAKKARAELAAAAVKS